MRFFQALIIAGVGSAIATDAAADVLVATRTIRAQSILAAADLAMVSGEPTLTGLAILDAVGQEARVTLYQGREIRADDIGPPALINRNQIVVLQFQSGPLIISTEARALGRGGAGDVLRVMNLSSKATVNGRVGSDGTVHVTTN
jgi:flagella basal body P-ring formation protein FlgA